MTQSLGSELDGAILASRNRERLWFKSETNVSIGSAYVDPEIEKMGAKYRHAARVKVTTRDGRAFEKLLLDRRGSPEKPLSRAEIENKFRHVVAPCVESARTQKIVEVVARLESLERIDELIALAAAPVAA